MNQDRHRRRGWRASTNFGQQWSAGPEAISRQNSEFLQAPEQRWGRPIVDEEDEDDTPTPGQSYAYPRTGDSSFAMMTGSTLTTGAMRGESMASCGESQRTPQARSGMRRPKRSESSGSSEVNSGAQVRR